MIGLTSTYYMIKAMRRPIKLIQGGQGAGKNYAIALILMERMLEKSIVITVMADTYDNLKDGIITDYESIFDNSGYSFYDYYNRNEKILYWGPSKMQFRYLADHKKDAGKSKRRDILYINEANKLGWAAVEHYVSRSKEIFLDFNPDFEFWAHTELEHREDCEKIIVTYKDNEMCPENEVRYIESRKHLEEWYKVYGLGLTGTYSERRMYRFSIVEDNAIPVNAKRLPRGMDFGQSPDPTIQVDLFMDGIDLYLDEVWCEHNLMPEKIKGAERDSIVDRCDRDVLKSVKEKFPMDWFKKDDEFYLRYEPESFKDDSGKIIDPNENDQKIITEIRRLKSWIIIGDSSGKTELTDLRKHGYEARGVGKPKGSVPTGIKRLQSYNLKVTRHSTNIISGLESWMRKIDHNGKIVPEPDGHEPDGLAAARYVMLAKAVW